MLPVEYRTNEWFTLDGMVYVSPALFEHGVENGLINAKSGPSWDGVLTKAAGILHGVRVVITQPVPVYSMGNLPAKGAEGKPKERLWK